MLIDALESGKAEWAPALTPPTMKAVLEAYEQQSAGMEKRWNALPPDRWDRPVELFGTSAPCRPLPGAFCSTSSTIAVS